MRKLIVTAALLCLVAAGCSSSGGSSYSSGDNTTAPASSSKTTIPKVAGLSGTVNDPSTKTVSGGKLEIDLDDFSFGPTYIKAKAGEKITVLLKNVGHADHNFTVESQHINVDISAGQTKTVTMTVPSTSTAFWCEYHQSKGMQGAFIVS